MPANVDGLRLFWHDSYVWLPTILLFVPTSSICNTDEASLLPNLQWRGCIHDSVRTNNHDSIRTNDHDSIRTNNNNVLGKEKIRHQTDIYRICPFRLIHNLSLLCKCHSSLRPQLVFIVRSFSFSRIVNRLGFFLDFGVFHFWVSWTFLILSQLHFNLFSGHKKKLQYFYMQQ